jgi:hypothetical protein
VSLNLCNLCGHAHRGSIVCAICGCSLEPLILQDEVKTIKEDNMVKKIVKWIWNIICWPFKKAHEWLTNSLPK